MAIPLFCGVMNFDSPRVNAINKEKELLMKILEKHNYDFQTQFDDPKWLHSIKCVLLEKEKNQKYLTHNIKPEHLKPIFRTTDNKFMSAEFNDQEIFLELKIKTKGIYFECMYKIDFKSGEIGFELYKPYLVKKEYVIPEDMSLELAGRVKKFMERKFVMANFCDEEFNKYYSAKFMPMFVKYAGYLEKLVKEKNCEGCKFLYKHQLNHVCKDFYTKNEFE